MQGFLVKLNFFIYQLNRRIETNDNVLNELELNEYAERTMGGRVPEEHVYREVASSETIDDRPEMVKLLKAIENPRIKAVLVREPQRLSRGDLEDAGRIIKLFRYTNTLVVTPQRMTPKITSSEVR